jgi:hypothetical protein
VQIAHAEILKALAGGCDMLAGIEMLGEAPGVECLAQMERWQSTLHGAVRRLYPWTSSAEMMPIWAVDYAHVCRLLSELDARIDELLAVLKEVSNAEVPLDASAAVTISQMVEQVAAIGREIDGELRRSSAACYEQTGRDNSDGRQCGTIRRPN